MTDRCPNFIPWNHYDSSIVKIPACQHFWPADGISPDRCDFDPTRVCSKEWMKQPTPRLDSDDDGEVD